MSPPCRKGNHSVEEGVQVLQILEDAQRSPHHKGGIHLREAADVVERAIDDKQQIVRKAHGVDKVLGVGNNGAVTNHHPFRLAGGASGEEDVGHPVGRAKRGILLSDGVEGGLGNVVLEGHRHHIGTMHGEIGHQEVDRLRGAQNCHTARGVAGTDLLGLQLDALPQLGISHLLASANHSHLVGTVAGIISQIIFYGHFA